MFGPAVLSPMTRGKTDLDARAERLAAYESWTPPTRLDFGQLVGDETWARHWTYYEQIIELMREAEVTATEIRETIKSTYLLAADRHPPADLNEANVTK
jgi:hypothetical protein